MADDFAKYARYPSLEDKVVFISGGNSGIGASFVEHFAHQGAKVAFIGRGEESAREVIAACKGAKHAPRFEICDVTDVKALRATIDGFASELGEFNVLINNAANDDRHKTEDVTEDYWERMLAVNLKHYFFATQAVLPGMRRQRWGSIINIGSISWMLKNPDYPVYAMCNAAILGLSKVQATEFGPDRIRVNSLTPGWVMTQKQIDKWLTPEGEADMMNGQALKEKLFPPDIARMALFLAADDSHLITAQDYIVDAGWV